MNDKKDGGQAYPISGYKIIGYENDHDYDNNGRPCNIREDKTKPILGEYFISQGMSLRDYFAGQALIGFINGKDDDRMPEWYAEGAYLIADAMLEARK